MIITDNSYEKEVSGIWCVQWKWVDVISLDLNNCMTLVIGKVTFLEQHTFWGKGIWVQILLEASFSFFSDQCCLITVGKLRESQ